jgi:hypothetical protein
MPDPTPQPDNAHAYDVYFYVAGGPRLFLRNPNHGIAVSDSGLAWTNYGEVRSVPFADIAAVHISSGALGNPQIVLDQCKIEFTDGSPALTAFNAGANGLPSDAQTPVYRAFVHDLHAQLAAHGTGTTRFTARMAPWRYNLLRVTLIVAALFFIVTPLILLLVTNDWHALIPVAMGLSLCWPVLRLLRNNTPRGYTPDALPDELMS